MQYTTVAINLNVLKFVMGIFFAAFVVKMMLSHDNGSMAARSTNAHFADSFISATKYHMPDYESVLFVKGVFIVWHSCYCRYFFFRCAHKGNHNCN